MKPQEFNEKIWACNDARKKYSGILDKILIMQEIIKKEHITDADKQMFINVLNNLTKTLVKDAISNENQATELLMAEGLEGTQPQAKFMEEQIEEVINNTNELSRIRTSLKNDEKTL